MINETVFHHDPGIGDGWSTNIGHGYAIDMIDVTDIGIVHPATGDQNGLNDPNRISGVRLLQLAGDDLYGTADSDSFHDEKFARKPDDVFFVIHMETKRIDKFPTRAALQAYARTHAVVLDLQPVATVYGHFRFGWFDLSAAFLLFAPPATALFWLTRRICKIAKTAPATATS